MTRGLGRVRLRAGARGQFRFVGWFLVACVITLALESIAEHRLGDEQVAQPVFALTGLYQGVVASGPRQPAPLFTAVLSIDPKYEPDLFNVCQRQRPFIARLLRGVARSSPSVIVLDKYFLANTCEPGDAGTASLQQAIHEVSETIPVIAGLNIDLGDERHPLKPHLALTGRLFSEGIVNLDRDNRRAALRWQVTGDDGAPAWLPTISLAAAEAYEPRLREKYPRLARLIEAREHPYISFLKSEDLGRFALYPARRFACEGTACSTEASLRGRIVVIGEINDTLDSHPSVIGRVPGFILQANYIEALLDQRWYRPVPGWVNYALGFLIYLAFHWILIRHHHALLKARGWRAIAILLKAALWSLVVIGATIAALYLTVMHAGWYVNPSTMGIVVIVMKFAELIFAALTHEAEHDDDRAGVATQ